MDGCIFVKFNLNFGFSAFQLIGGGVETGSKSKGLEVGG